MRGRKPQANAVRRGLTDALAVQGDSSADLGVKMPADIAADPLQSAIWELVVPEFNHFSEQDLPQLRELVMWHSIFEQARQAVTMDDGTGRIAIFSEDGKKHPALAVMKEASAEVRALSDHLGVSPLARSRLGLMEATTVKTAAETAAMFRSAGIVGAIDEAYPELVLEVVDDTD